MFFLFLEFCSFFLQWGRLRQYGAILQAMMLSTPNSNLDMLIITLVKKIRILRPHG